MFYCNNLNLYILVEIEYADSMTTDDLDETVCYSDSGNDSDSTTTVDSPYFCEDSSDESDENDQIKKIKFDT